MPCISPILTASKHYVPCGRCGSCRQARVADWTFRIKQESKHHVFAWWVCLTYSDEYLVYNIESRQPELVHEHLTKFLKDVRAYQDNNIDTDDRIRFYAVGEYGEDYSRPHYHIILWSAHRETMLHLSKIWYHGFPSIETLDVNGIPYMCKYHLNPLPDLDTREKPFARMSKKPGIGHYYVSFSTDEGYQNYMRHRKGMQNFVYGDDGKKQRMPRYLREKIFDKNQRAQLAKASLEENDRKYLQELARQVKLQGDELKGANYLVDQQRYHNENYKYKSNKNRKL